MKKIAVAYLALAADTLLNFLYQLWHHRRIIRQMKDELLKPFDVRLGEMKRHIRGTHITLESPAFVLTAMKLVEAFKNCPGADNYLSLTHNDDSDGQQYEIYIQRVDGKRPADVVDEMRQRFVMLNALPARFNYFGLEGSVSLTPQKDGKWLCYAWGDDGALLYAQGQEDEDDPIEFQDSTPDGAARQMIDFIREHQSAIA